MKSIVNLHWDGESPVPKNKNRKEETIMLSEYVERVAIMIKTGASEETIENYIFSLYANGKITERGYSLLNGMDFRK